MIFSISNTKINFKLLFVLYKFNKSILLIYNKKIKF